MTKRRRTRKKFTATAWVAGTGLVVGWGLAIGLGSLHFKNRDQNGSAKPARANQSDIQVEKDDANVLRFRQFEEALNRTAQKEGMQGATIAACLLDSSGKVVFSYEGERSIIPASALKTVTTATALEMLGPGFRFKTLLQGTAAFPEEESPPPDGTYHGDFVITGGGDPSLTSADLENWGARLAALGIKKVDGRVIGDGKVFPELTTANAWDWGDVGNYYGAPAAGLNIDRNMFQATFHPGTKIGDKAPMMDLIPEVPGIVIHNLMLTSDKKRHARDSPYVYSGPYAKSITFRGAIPIGANEEVVLGALPDPVFATSAQFKRILTQRGIAVTGAATTIRALEIAGEAGPADLHGGLEHASLPLVKLIEHTHRISDNVYAECMFRLLGMGHPDGDGQAAIEAHWASRGIDLTGLRMEDGSGLARADLIRPVDLARVNYAARHGKYGDYFFATLREQYDGRMRWKGGAMSRVRAYVGFTTNKTEELTFVLAFNNYAAGRVAVAKAREEILMILAEL